MFEFIIGLLIGLSVILLVYYLLNKPPNTKNRSEEPNPSDPDIIQSQSSPTGTSTTPHSSSPPLPPKPRFYIPTNSNITDDTRAVNMFISRIWQEVTNCVDIKERWRTRLETKLNDKNHPDYLGKMTVEFLEIGSFCPFISNLSHTEKGDELFFHGDMEYREGFRFKLNTELYLNWPTPKIASWTASLMVSIIHLKGKMSLYIPAGFDPLCLLAFEDIPTTDIIIEPKLNRFDFQNLPFVIDYVKRQLQEKIIKKEFVLPQGGLCFRVPLPKIRSLHLKTINAYKSELLKSDKPDAHKDMAQLHEYQTRLNQHFSHSPLPSNSTSLPSVTSSQSTAPSSVPSSTVSKSNTTTTSTVPPTTSAPTSASSISTKEKDGNSGLSASSSLALPLPEKNPLSASTPQISPQKTLSQPQPQPQQGLLSTNQMLSQPMRSHRVSAAGIPVRPHSIMVSNVNSGESSSSTSTNSPNPHFNLATTLTGNLPSGAPPPIPKRPKELLETSTPALAPVPNVSTASSSGSSVPPPLPQRLSMSLSVSGDDPETTAVDDLSQSLPHN